MTNEELRTHLAAAVRRIVQLEADRDQLLAAFHEYTGLVDKLIHRVNRHEDELDVIAGRPPKQMSPEDIAKSIGSTHWSP